MAIFRILGADIYCDKCNKHLAYMTFDAKDEPIIEHMSIICDECKVNQPKEKETE